MGSYIYSIAQKCRNGARSGTVTKKSRCFGSSQIMGAGSIWILFRSTVVAFIVKNKVHFSNIGRFILSRRTNSSSIVRNDGWFGVLDSLVWWSKGNQGVAVSAIHDAHKPYTHESLPWTISSFLAPDRYYAVPKFRYNNLNKIFLIFVLGSLHHTACNGTYWGSRQVPFTSHRWQFYGMLACHSTLKDAYM